MRPKVSGGDASSFESVEDVQCYDDEAARPATVLPADVVAEVAARALEEAIQRSEDHWQEEAEAMEHLRPIQIDWRDQPATDADIEAMAAGAL